MLFTSHGFILGFLPIVLLVVFGLRAAGTRTAAKVALLIASIFFYGCWNLDYVPLLLAIILFNYGVGRILVGTQAREDLARRRSALLVFGLVANVLTLVYFKYTNFFADTANDLFRLDVHVRRILLPIGLSFVTFQKIAFLVDAYGGAVSSFTFLDFCLFSAFFPQLNAGPIVHHREMMPQFSAERALRYSPIGMASGLAMFASGLFKKMAVADNIATIVQPVFSSAAHGDLIEPLRAWIGAVTYTFQIYFDFSGYTDMAIGLGLMFGVQLPANFDSPFKASSIIVYWQRWHMSLTRFLTAYIYNPIVLGLTRRRMRTGKHTRGVSVEAFLVVLAFPTMTTMTIAGFWHGAGAQFIVFGVLHGLYLSVNHAWRMFGPKDDAARPLSVLRQVVGVAATFLAVVVAHVFFRADSVRSAMIVLRSMVTMSRAAPTSALLTPCAWIAGAAFFVWCLPNSQQLLARFSAHLGGEPSERPVPTNAARLCYWKPTLPWALGAGAIVFYALMSAAAPSEFLYFRF